MIKGNKAHCSFWRCVGILNTVLCSRRSVLPLCHSSMCRRWEGATLEFPPGDSHSWALLVSCEPGRVWKAPIGQSCVKVNLHRFISSHFSVIHSDHKCTPPLLLCSRNFCQTKFHLDINGLFVTCFVSFLAFSCTLSFGNSLVPSDSDFEELISFKIIILQLCVLIIWDQETRLKIWFSC